jgi:serine/threonine-protein kinase
MRNAADEVEAAREIEALTFGRYQLTRKLSQGGMAEIWLARQSGAANFEKEVVVKIVLPSLAEHDGYEGMLLEEARMAARLNHPNIVQVLDVGKLDGRFFIAMELIEGESLLSILVRALDQRRRLPPGFVCRVIADVLAGLEFAHTLGDGDGRGHGIIHRDISPPNVIVSYAGTTKIVDFGIAKATRRSVAVTDAGQFKGKLGYMAPEQVRLQPLDGRCDIFAAGVMLWELLAGKRLFRRADDRETVRALLEDPVPPLGPLNPSCPAALDQIIARALQRPVHARYPSARAMRRALEDMIRQLGWQADPLTMQRVMSELFPARKQSLRAMPRLVTPDDDTTRRRRKLDTDDTQPQVVSSTVSSMDMSGADMSDMDIANKNIAAKEVAGKDVIVEMSASFATSSERIALAPTRPLTLKPPPPPATVRVGGNTIDRMLRMRRVLRIAVGAALGVGVSAFILVGFGHRGSMTPELPVAAIVAPPETPPVTPAPPPFALVELRLDGHAALQLDGAPVSDESPLTVAPAMTHVLSVQRPGHRMRTLTLPQLAAGEKLLVTVWRDLEGPRHADTISPVDNEGARTDGE